MKKSYALLVLNVVVLFFFVSDFLFGERSIYKFLMKDFLNFSYGPIIYYLLFIILATIIAALMISIIRKKENPSFFTINLILSIVNLAGVVLMFLVFGFALFFLAGDSS